MQSIRNKSATLEQVVYSDESVSSRRLVCTRFYGQSHQWSAIGIDGDLRVVCYSGSRDRFDCAELELLARRWIEFALPYL